MRLHILQRCAFWKPAAKGEDRIYNMTEQVLPLCRKLGNNIKVFIGWWRKEMSALYQVMNEKGIASLLFVRSMDSRCSTLYVSNIVWMNCLRQWIVNILHFSTVVFIMNEKRADFVYHYYMQNRKLVTATDRSHCLVWLTTVIKSADFI